MASTTADPAVAVHRVIDYARDRLEIELERLNETEAQYHGRSTERLTPLKKAREVKLSKTLDVAGLAIEEAVAKALDLVLQYWKQHNKVGISEAITTPGRRDIAKVADLKVPKVNALVFQKLKQDPGFFRDDEEAAVDPSDQVRESTETDDAQDLHSETPTRVRRQTQGQQPRRQHRLNIQEKQAAPGSLSPLKLRSGRRVENATGERREDEASETPDMEYQTEEVDRAEHRAGHTGTESRGRTTRGRGQDRSPSRSPIETHHDHQQKDGEPAPARIDTPRTPQNDGQLDGNPIKADPSPVFDAPESATVRSDARVAHPVKLEYPTTPTREATRRYPRHGGSRIGRNAANVDASATVIARPRPTRRRAAPKPGPASKPSAPSPQHRETPHLLDMIDRQCDELKQRLDLLEASVRSQQQAIRDTQRELNDFQRVAADKRRALAVLDREFKDRKRR